MDRPAPCWPVSRSRGHASSCRVCSRMGDLPEDPLLAQAGRHRPGTNAANVWLPTKVFVRFWPAGFSIAASSICRQILVHDLCLRRTALEAVDGNKTACGPGSPARNAEIALPLQG